MSQSYWNGIFFFDFFDMDNKIIFLIPDHDWTVDRGGRSFSFNSVIFDVQLFFYHLIFKILGNPLYWRNNSGKDLLKNFLRQIC